MPAQLVSSTPSPLYAVPGKNYAPSVPLKEMAQNRRVLSPNPLSEALQKKFQAYMSQDYGLRTEKWDIGRQISNLREGKNLLLRNVRSGKLMTISKQDGRFSDFKTVSGQFQFYSTKLLSEWLSSNPELDPVCPSSDDQIEEYIEAVKIVQDYYDKKLFDVDYRTMECLSAQDYGTWITRFRYDEECDDIVGELLDFPSCVWDWRKRAEESPYFIFQSKCSTAELSFKYDAEISSDGDGDGEYSGLRYVEMIAKQGGNTTGNGKDNPYGQYSNVENENIVTEMWLQPEAYCDIEIPVSEKTVSGGVIPKGNLMDLFPNGVCVTGINGMKTILQISAENHKDHIVSGLYHVQSFCGVGKGLSDMVDAVKELNDLHSQLLAHTKAHSMPAFAYDSNSITEAQARKTAHPRGMIAVDFTQAPEGTNNINQLIQAIVPGNAAPAAFQMREYLKQDVQIAAQVTDFSNGLPGVDNKTATGAKIGDANAATVLVPQHLNLANFRKRSAIVIYKLFRKYKNDPQFFATKNINGITKGKTFNNEIFEKYVDIDFEIVANSEVPETPYAQRDATMQLLQAMGGAVGLIQGSQMNPEMVGDLASIFGVTKLQLPRKTDIARVCRKRIEQAKKLLSVEMQVQNIISNLTGQQPDNAQLPAAIVSQLTPPIHPREPFHLQKIEWLSELLDDDEMMFAPEEVRDVISEMIDMHIEAQAMSTAQSQFLAGAANLAANAPAILGDQLMTANNQRMQQAYEAEQMQAQQQQAVEQGAMELAAKHAEAGIQETQASADHSRALALKDVDHANAAQQQSDAQDHQLKVAAMSHLASIQAAKSKPKVGAK